LWNDDAPHVILIAGPAGAGKTTMARLIGSQPGWVALSEDEFWGRLPRDPHLLRTDAEKAVIQGQVVEATQTALADGLRVVIEFIIYEDPPQPILFYAETLTRAGARVAVRVLRPDVTTLMRRQAERGNAHDTEVDEAVRRQNAEHQVRCLHSTAIDPAWVVAAAHEPVDGVYAAYFASMVEPRSC